MTLSQTKSIADVCAAILKPKGTEYSACNFFVQAVARELEKGGKGRTIGDTVAGTANEIVARLATVGSPWIFLGKNPASAMKHADGGYLVIGGKSASGSGHVFVVVPGGPSKAGLPTPWGSKSRGGAPVIYHGSANTKLRTTSTTQVDIVFSRADEKEVIYAAIADPRQAPAKTGVPTASRLQSPSGVAGWFS